MSIFILIVLGIVVLFLIANKYFLYKSRQFKRLDKEKRNYRLIRTIPEGDRTLEEIMFSKPANEVMAELSAKNPDDLTGNEILVLSELTKWYEENPSYKGS